VGEVRGGVIKMHEIPENGRTRIYSGGQNGTFTLAFTNIII
jgi:hypothetical protein